MLESEDGELARCTLDVFEHSQYFADQLVSHTELLSEVSAACGAKQGRLGFVAPLDPEGLRRFSAGRWCGFRATVCIIASPVFTTLKRTSGAGGIGDRGGLRNAVAEACATRRRRVPITPRRTR